MEASSQLSIYQRFDSLASSDLSEFRQFFKRLHKVFPEQAAEACLLYISSHGLDPASKSMAYWLVSDSTYVSVLVDGDCLPAAVAIKAVAVLKEVDPQFLLKFSKATAKLVNPSAILHTLVLIPAVGDYAILIPWLRSLGQNPEARVRSRAAKLLCELRPNKGLIEKHLQSPEARIRAGAVEALWHSTDPHAIVQLRSASLDSHHRVAINAFVGLHYQGEPGALDRLHQFCHDAGHSFRLAAAWALGEIGDPLSISYLRDLTHDKLSAVRKRSLKSLLTLESARPQELRECAAESINAGNHEPETSAPEPEPLPDHSPSPELQPTEPGRDFNFSLFR